MYGDYSRAQEVLHRPFNISTHKETFKNYLEVSIDADGVVHYAVPSHQEFLIAHLVATKYGTRQQLNDAVPREYWFDMMTWLTQESQMVSVWNDHYLGQLNDVQRITLQRLKDEGLYLGEV